MKITVIGLGFVGYPLLKTLHKAGHTLVGIDISKEKIESFKSDPELNAIEFISRIELFSDADAFILALPTPLDEQNNPDLSAILSVCDKIGDVLNENQIVIIESTYPVRTTRNLILPKLGKNIGEKIVKLVYSPERINPGDPVWDLQNTPKLVAVEDEFSKRKIEELYGEVFQELVFVENYEIAEAAKLLENIYRYININFINEFQQNCDALGLEASKVIAAAGTKPFGFQSFLPSLGVGGHCIPIAPQHFISSLNENESSNGFINHGKKINQTHLMQVLKKIERDFIELNKKKVLVVGVTYKSGVADLRESPALRLIEILRKQENFVSWYDPLIEFFDSEKRVNLSEQSEVALICVNQSDQDLDKILQNNQIVLDISNGMEIRRLK